MDDMPAVKEKKRKKKKYMHESCDCREEEDKDTAESDADGEGREGEEGRDTASGPWNSSVSAPPPAPGTSCFVVFHPDEQKNLCNHQWYW